MTHSAVGSRRTAAVATLLALAALLLAPAAASAHPRLRYVALGDSYTSAPLTGAPAGRPLGCARSLNNYPHRVAEVLGAGLTDVSCGSAKTDDFSAPQLVADGANPPQFDALDPAVTLVTVGIGGNDIGFGGIVSGCVSLTPFGSPCRDRYTAGGVDQLAARIAAAAPKIAAVLQEVHARAPRARVLLVGYPAILPPSGPGCYPAVPYTAADVAYLRDTEQRLNTMLAGQAGAGGVEYVHTYPSTFGHDVCQLPLVRWIEGLVPTLPAAPVHPNALGEQALADAVLARLDAAAT